MGADSTTYKTLWNDLNKNLALGSNKYPKNVSHSHEILAEYVDINGGTKNINVNMGAVTFTQFQDI